MKQVLVALVALALVATACGGDTDTSDEVASLDTESTVASAVTVTTIAEASEEEALLAFAACMRDNGFEIDDPTVDSAGNLQLRPSANAQQEGIDPETAQAALDVCEDLLGGVALGFQQGVDQTDFQDDILVWAACMRDNGYDIDDPDFTPFGPGQEGGPFGDLDQDDPAFQTAQAECEDMLPGFGGFGPDAGTNGG